MTLHPTAAYLRRLLSSVRKGLRTEDLAALLPHDVSRSTMSDHLTALRKSGMARSVREKTQDGRSVLRWFYAESAPDSPRIPARTVDDRFAAAMKGQRFEDAILRRQTEPPRFVPHRISSQSRRDSSLSSF